MRVWYCGKECLEMQEDEIWEVYLAALLPGNAKQCQYALRLLG